MWRCPRSSQMVAVGQGVNWNSTWEMIKVNEYLGEEREGGGVPGPEVRYGRSVCRPK